MLLRGCLRTNVLRGCRKVVRTALVLLITAAFTLSSLGGPAILSVLSSSRPTENAAALNEAIAQNDGAPIDTLLSRNAILVESNPRCCCAVKGHTRSCCCTAGATPGKSCCGVKKAVAQRSPTAKTKTANQDVIPTFAACDCGDGSDVDSISTGQPRIHALSGHYVTLSRNADAAPIAVDHFQSVIQAPDTPPPRQLG